jgi:hypothetical protein
MLKDSADRRVLPADLTGVGLSFRLSTRWNENPSDGPSFWHVSADAWGLEDESATSHVGSFQFYRIEPLETEDLLGVMDGYDGDLGHIAEAIIDSETGEINDELRGSLAGLESDILVLYKAELEEQWRGFGIGAVLAGQAIKQFGHGCLGVVLQPASILPRTENDAQARQQAAKKIAKAWGKIGFTPLGEDLMVLDLATTTLSAALERQSALARRLPSAAAED